jgi:Flp pilus assembly protein TadD
MALKSMCLEELGRADEAVVAMEAALALGPDDDGMNNNLGYFYARRGMKLDQAERMIRKALAGRPQEISFQDSLGWVFYKQGKIPEAERVFQLILSASSPEQKDDPIIMDHAGDVMWRLGRKEKAVSLWRQAVELAGKQKAPTVEIREVLSTVPMKVQAAEANQSPQVAPVVEGFQDRQGEAGSR